jgi:hypothetical protein
LAPIRKEFIALLALFVGADKKEIEELADNLLDAIIDGCEIALSIAIEKDLLPAHEAMSSFRHRILLEELSSVQKMLLFLSNQQEINPELVMDFEEKYRSQIAYLHGKITPPNFDKTIRININNLYVDPNFVKKATEKSDEQQILKMKEFLYGIYRIVILGTPGGGKSTFAQKLCYELATKYSERIFAGRQITPILIMLRDFGAEKKAHSCSILQFIEANTNSKYQIQPPVGVFEYMLLNGRALVIFDGLDELLDTSYRQEISNAIETFCMLYPSVPVVVTSREVGYEQAPLDENIFEVYRLSPFDNRQVAQYVNKWFDIDTDLTMDQRRQKVASFLEESEIVSDIRENPLMLALMCNIYRGENYIPRNRPDVYEKCAVMLFDRWDKSRGIRATENVEELEAHIRPLMMYLAFWIYSNEALQSGVTERILVEKASDYLFEKRFEDRDEAKSAASKFIEFCKGRAWVFADTGTTRDGEGLYQFTHRTFLEYFTAAYMVRTNPTPEMLGSILFPKIIKREWDVVAQLAFQIQNKNVEGAADHLFLEMIKRAQENDSSTSWNIVSFAARCMEFIIPRPKIARDFTTLFMNKWLAWGLLRSKAIDEKYLYGSANSPQEILGYLLNSAIENRKVIMDSMNSYFTDKMKCGTDEEASLILEICFHLTFSLYSLRNRERPSQESLDSCNSLSGNILNEHLERIIKLSAKSISIAIDIERRQKISTVDLVKLHGIDSIFIERRYTMYPNTFTVSIVQSLTIFLIDLPYSTNLKEEYLDARFKELEEIGKIFIDTKPILDPKIIPDRDLFYHSRINLGKKKKIKYSMNSLLADPDVLFGAFILFASALELSLNYEDVKNQKIILFDHLRTLLISRFEPTNVTHIQDEIRRLNFNEHQKNFITNWISKSITIFKKTKIK